MRRLVAKIPCAGQKHNKEHINVALAILLTSYLNNSWLHVIHDVLIRVLKCLLVLPLKDLNKDLLILQLFPRYKCQAGILKILHELNQYYNALVTVPLLWLRYPTHLTLLPLLYLVLIELALEQTVFRYWCLGVVQVNYVLLLQH